MAKSADVVTIHDVARAAGVSTATVSRALRGLPRVGEATRARVLAAAAELDYVVSAHGSGLSSGKSRVVGVVAPFIARWYFSQVIAGAERAAREQGYYLMLFGVGNVGDQRVQLAEQRQFWQRVDAALVLSMALEPAEVALLDQLALPVVSVGFQGHGWPCVRIDDTATAVLGTRHLVELGHRRIGYIGGDPRTDVYVATPADRRAGYEQVLAEAGVSVDPSLIVESDWSVAGAVASAQRLFDLAEPPTAIFVASDEMAMGAMFAARGRGYRIPEELSVVGVDGHDVSFTLGLTTVAQPAEEQGFLAGQLLLQKIAGIEPQALITVPTALIVRGSTGPPRSG